MKDLYVAKGFLLFLFIGLTLHLHADPPATSPFYNGDLTHLKKQARKTSTPYFIYFQLPDCESCKQMDEKAWKDPRVSRFVAQHYLGFRVNAITPAQGQKALEEYGIFVYPALLVFDANGKLQKHIEGYIDAENLLNIFNGKPLCTPFENLATSTDAPVAAQPAQTFISRPVQQGKRIDAPVQMTQVEAPVPANTASRTVNMRSLPDLGATPMTTALPAESVSNVQNDVYKKYNELHRAALAKNSATGSAALPATAPAAREVQAVRPGTANPAPTLTRTVNMSSVSATETSPALLRKLPDTQGPALTRTNTSASLPANQKPTAALLAIEDPRFRAYNPWKFVAPVEGVNYSLFLESYATAELALAQIESISKYWPNTIWAYQEGKNGPYRLALGTFYSEEQAQRYADLLLRSQQLKCTVSDLFDVVSKTPENENGAR